MASQTTSKIPVKPQTKVQTYVNRQLDRTRRQVKSTDLITRLIVGVLMVLAMLQIFAIVDAWVWSFNPTARWICFLSLISAVVAYGTFAVAPLFLRKIHPDYAAKMIEDERPSFKNSLLNYVSLRKKPSRTHTAIMDAVSKQAALDLQTVPDDAAVDQSSIIKSGMFLLGVIGFAVIYWLVSPKDPLQSFSRVLMPSIKQAAPSVVQVMDVSPGDHEIFFGDSVEVSATIKGSFSPEDVKLVYSTTDGQLVDQEVAMQPETDANRRFSAMLSPDQSGIQQSLVYRVVARDGQSPDYDIVVKPNPSISVDVLTITPPAYTGLPVETLGGQESIEAPEGSTVRVEAMANLPIKLAYMELLKRNSNAGDQQADFTIIETVNMLVDSQDTRRAAGDFFAVLNSDRTDAKASHYRLKFLSTTDDRNQQANISPIRVIADLAPELDVLNPLENRSKLPANESMLIEARAFDIDYGISSVELNMNNEGSSVFPAKPLQLTSEQGKQRVRGGFLFKPVDHFLQPGDVVVFDLTANDNRVSHLSGMLDPNSVQSRQYQVEIVDAVENPKTPPENEPQEREQQQNGDQQKPSDQQKQSEEGANQNGDSGGEQDSGDSQQEDGESSEQKESESGSSNGDESSESSGGDDSDGGESSESGDGQNGDGAGDGGQMSEEGKSQRGESGSEGGQDQPDGDSRGSDGNSTDSGSSEFGSSGDQREGESNGDESAGGSDSRGGEQQPQNQPPKNGEGSNQQGDGSSQSTEGGQADNEQGSAGGDDGQQDGDQRKPLGENATDGDRMSRLEEMIKEEQARNGEGQDREGQPSDTSDAAEQKTGSGRDPEQNDPRESEGTGSTQEDDAKVAEEGAEKNAQNGDSNSKSSEGSQDGTAKGSSGSQTGEQSNEGASSDDSNKGQSNETGGNEAGDSKTEQDDENSTNAKDGQGQAGKSKEGGAQASDQSGENGGNQQPSEGKGQGGEGQGQSGEGQGQGGEGQGQGGEGQGQGGEGQGQGGESGKPTEDGGGAGSGGGGRQHNMIREKENLEHSRKATDMVLNRLEEERYDPDPELLDELNWSKDDLNQFLNRWNQMKQQAETGTDPAAKRRYEQAIKSLGLSPDSGQRKVKGVSDQKTGFKTDSAVNRPPPKVAPAFKAYLRDRNRAAQE